MTEPDILAALNAQLDDTVGCGEPGCPHAATRRIIHRCGMAAALVCADHARLWWNLLPILDASMRHQAIRAVCRGCHERITFHDEDWTEEELP